MSVTRDHVEKGICIAWTVFLLTLIRGEFEGFYNSLIIGTAVLIPCLRGWSWLRRYEIRWILVGGGIYTLSVSIALLVAEPFPAGLDTIREYPGKGLLILFNLLFLFRRKENWIWFMWGIAGSVSLALFLAYYNLFTPDALNLTINRTAEIFPGSISILGYHKNLFGMFLSHLVPLLSGFAVVLFYQSGVASEQGWVLLTITLVALPIVFLTKSRSTHVAVLIGMVFPPFILALKSGYWKSLASGSIALILLFVIVLMATEPGQSIVDRWQQEHVITMAGRTNKVWPQFLELVRERPIFGHGLKLDTSGIEGSGHEHSTYLAHLTRTGFIGLAGFCIFLLLTLFTSLRKLYRESITTQFLLYMAFLSCFLSGVLLEGIVEPIQWPRLYLITLSGLIASGCLIADDTVVSESSPATTNSGSTHEVTD